MPKIRGIRPEFWTDEDIVDLSIPARLLFIGLWNFACDNGHLDDKPKQIKMRILPGDDINADKLLEELVSNGRIRRENGVITILKFARHQKPHPRWWSTCDLPECTKPGGSTTVVEGSAKGSETSRPRENNERPREKTAVVDVDVDVDGDGELTRAGKPAKRATQLPASWKPNDNHASLAAENRTDLDREVAKFRDHAIANGVTRKDWDAAFRNWLRNAADWGRRSQPEPAPRSLPNARDLEPAPPGMSDEESWAWMTAQRAKRAQA